jgi:hypothetical protein
MDGYFGYGNHSITSPARRSWRGPKLTPQILSKSARKRRAPKADRVHAARRSDNADASTISSVITLKRTN